MPRSIFLYILLACSFSRLAAQPHQYLFAHLGVNEGLASDNVMSVQQDAKGYIWIATSSGLQRYDGQRFINFRHETENPGSIPEGAIYGLQVDKHNRLWLLFGGFRMGYVNTNDFSFHEVPVRYSKDQLSKASGGMYLDRDGNLMLVAVGQGVFTYNEKANEFSAKHNLFSLPGKWKPLYVWQDERRNYWVGCDSGLVRIDSRTKLPAYRGHNPGKDPVIEALGNLSVVIFAYVDRHDRFWMTSWPPTGMKILGMDPHTRQVKEWQDVLGHSIQGKYYELRGITELRDSSIWFAGYNLFVRLNESATGFQQIPNNVPGEFSIRYDGINQLYEDRESNVWISTNKGLFRFNPPAQLFRLVRNKRPGSGTIYEPDVTGILPLRNGTLLVSTWGNGLFAYNNSFDPVSSIAVEQGQRQGEGMAWCMLERANGDIWRGNQGGFIFIYNAATRTTEKLQPTAFENSTVRQVVEDRVGNIWFGTQRGHIIKWSAATGIFTRTHDLHSTVNRLYRDSSGMIWACTSSNGVSRIDPVTGNVVAQYSTGGQKGASLRNINAADIIQYNDSIFVIAANGLNCLNVRTNRFWYFSTENGLQTNDITNLIKDDSGYIWMSTGAGIISYQPEKEKLSFYTAADGVHSNAFHVGSSCKLPDGRIAFGTAHDLLVFDPHEITVSEYVPPKVEVSGLTIMNRSFSVDSIMRKGKIELQYNQSSMIIDLSTLNYQNLYTVYYRMDGLDKGWTDAGKLNQAIYNYLPPGDYVFQAACKKPDGSMGEITSIVIGVKAPFWNTRWFYALVALTVGAVFFWLDRSRQQRLRSEQQMRASIAGNLHEDVNTTLRDINVLSEIAGMKAHTQPEKSKEYIYEIQRKSRNMVIAMNDVLWSIDPANDNMPRTIERIHEVAQAMQQRYKAEVQVETDEQVMRMNLSMKIRLEFIIIYKLAMMALVEASQAPFTRVKICQYKGKLQLLIHSPGVTLEKTNSAVFKYLAEMKSRANAIHASLQVLSENGGTEVRVIVRV